MAENPYIDLAKQEDPPANPYIALAQQSTAQEAQQAVAATADRNPDVEANLQSLAARYNLPVEAVRLELPKIERKATIDAIDYEILARDNPKTAGFLRDPAKAAIARDDLEALKQLENQFGTLQQIYGPQPGLVSVVKGLLSSFVTGGKLTREGIRAQAGDLFGSAEMAQDAIRRAEQARFEQSLTDPQFQSSTAQGLYSGGQSLLQQIPSLTAAIALRNPNIAIGAAGAQTQTEAYTRYRARGATPGEASFGATIEGAIEVATEKLPMDFLVKSLGKTGATKFLLEYFVKEGLTEQAATLAQDAIDTAIANPEKTWGDYFAERPDAAYQTALATLVSSGVLGAANAAALRLSSKERQAQAAREAAAALEQVNKLAAASKVLQRKPEAFEQFIEQAADGGPVTDIYIDPQQLLNQSDVDVAALAAVSPSVAAQLQEAIATGSLIKVPVAEYASKIAPTELAQPLTDLIKTDPLGMTRAEAEEFFQTQGDQLKAEVERLLTDKQQDDTFKQSRDAVYKNVLDQLTAANRFTQDVNVPYATLMANFYSVMGARQGMTPEQMFAKYPVQITAEQVGKTPVLDQGALPSGEYLNMPANPSKEVLDSFGRVEEVPLSAARRTQSRMDWEKFNKGEHPGALVQGYEDKPVAVRLENGEYLVYDGHHRTVKAIEAGKQSLPMYVVDAKQYDPANAGRKSAPVSQREIDNLLSELGTTFDQEANGSTAYTEPTITVDGKERFTANSNGQPIAATKEGLENFWRWFGDSKVVDASGKPLVVYHGSPDMRFLKEDARFKSRYERSGFGSDVGVHWFASTERTAKTYADPRRAFDYQNAEEGVFPAYLRIENPVEVEGGGREWSDVQQRGRTTDVVEEAQKAGNDGVIINNVKDDYNNARTTPRTRTFTVFSSEQIKSINNTGAYSAEGDVFNQSAQPFGTDRNLNRMYELAIKAPDYKTFKDSITQSHLMDLSDQEAHRFGRAFTHYADEPRGDIQYYLDNEPVFVDNLKYESKVVYRAITSPGDTIKIYRAVPSGASDQIRVGDYVALDRSYAEKHLRSVLEGEQNEPGKIIEATVPKSDVIWGQADAEEWAYSPRSQRERFVTTKGFYDAVKAGEYDPSILYQSAPDPDNAPWYYSQVQRVVENLKQPKATGEQWLKTIQNTPGVKQEELDWMGLPEWLAAQEGPITKASLLEYVQANQIQVDEVVKGGVGNNPYSSAEEWQAAIDDAEAQGDWAEAERLTRLWEGIDDQTGSAADGTKFGQYTLPGGENYRELLMTLPDNKEEIRQKVRALNERMVSANYAEDYKEYDRLKAERDAISKGYFDSEDYTSSHFAEKNILAHIRFNERTDADGKRVLFIEEIQSDWHQAGRDKGYKVSAKERARADELMKMADEAGGIGNLPTELQAEAKDISQRLVSNGVPDAPFKTTWPELAFKRALRWAVDNGFDRVAWTTGEQQADRYDLSKQVDEVQAFKNEDGTFDIEAWKGGDLIEEQSGLNEKALEATLGKDLAKKIIAEEGESVPLKGGLSYAGEDLKVGGEGMRAFYDKMLPNMVNKMVKKWGGKVGDTKIGVEDNQTFKFAVRGSDGVLLHATNSREGAENWIKYNGSLPYVKDPYVDESGTGTAVHSLDITPAMRESVKAGLALFQEKRGTFNPSTNTITLLKAADLSTFLHECGHFFLETMNKMALDANAPADIKADMDIILKWFGVGSLVEWNAMTLDQQRENHEKFARGFEAYLFEGKSPSVEMDGIFKKFRAWLLNVYRSLTSLKVDLNDEVRGVFDRMLATTEQIKEAEASRSMLPLFVTAEDAGMTPDEFKAYYETGLEATQEAIANLETRSLRDMKWLGNAKGRALKALQKEAAARRKTVQEEVTREVLGEPVNQARQFLKRGTINGEKVDGPFKMDNTAAKEIAQASGIDFASIEGKYGKYGLVAEGGLAPDTVAEMFGFSSGSELLRALSTAEDVKTKIEGMTDQRMLERYGDLNSPEAIEQAANAAIHNEARARFVATELNALQKAMGSRKVLAAAAKDYAAEMVNRQRVRDLRPSRYEAAEARAAKASADAFKKGDTQTAAAEKKNQLVQTYAAKAAYEAQERIEKRLGYLKKFTKDSIRKAVDPAYVDQIQALLERFDLKQRSLKDIDKRASLVAWAAEQQALGLDPDIPPEMLNEANRKNYKDMTVEEFDGLVDTVRQIEHLGRLKNKLLTAADQRQFDTAISEMTERIRESSGGKVKDNRTRATFSNWVYKGFAGFMAEHRKFASLLREMDGWQDGGPLWEYLARGMNASGDKEASMLAKATRDMAELLKPLRDGGKLGGKGVFYPEIGMSLNREELFMVALNAGNEGNLQRLMGGRNWQPEQVASLLGKMPPEFADMAQSVWDYFETLRPELGRVERALYGKEPEWVPATPVAIGGKTVQGGYFPIVYDPSESPDVKANMQAEDAKGIMRGALRSSSTRSGMTKSRAEKVNGQPLLLTLEGMSRGVNDTIHRIAWQEWVTDANRIMRNKAFSSAATQHYGDQVYDELVKAVQDIATGRSGDQASWAGRVFGHLRRGSSVVALGLNVTNSLMNLSGLSQTAVRIGPRWMMEGVGQFAKSPVDATAMVMEKSVFMQNRSRTYNRELNEMVNTLRAQTKVRQGIDIASMTVQTVTQLAVDIPTWLGAYAKAQAAGETDARAAALADQAVIDAQSGGQMKDLAAIQRGGEFKKLLTAFYGYFSATYNLAVESTKKTDFKDPLDVVRLGRDYLLLVTVPALWTLAVKEALTGGDDDEDELLKKVLAEHISYPMGMIVGLREFSPAVQKAFGLNTYSFGYGGPAGFRFFGELDKLGQQANQGDLDRALLRSASTVAGITLHLPTGQANKTIDGIIALSEGRTNNPLVLLGGAPPK